MQSSRKYLKVTCNGETKRLKITNDYSKLVELTNQAFSSKLPKDVKFFYLDDENEIISINSQSDFSEALDIEDLSALKLTVAHSVNEARVQLNKSICENMQLAESLSQSQFMQDPLRSSRTQYKESMNDFHLIGSDDLQRRMSEIRPIENNENKGTHEIGCGDEDVLMDAVDIATDVNNLVTKDDAGCNTAKVNMQDQNVHTMVETSNMGSQASKKTADVSVGNMRAAMQNAGSQIERTVKEAEVSCDLIIPDGDQECVENEVTCVKCLGSQVNKKGLPCRKCNGTGVIHSKDLSELVQVVRDEVREYCTVQFRGMLHEHLEQRKAEQEQQVHEKFACDGCDVNPIKGIRFMCSVCSNYDLCEACERKGVHAEHPMLKIRQPSQAPAKLICQYKNAQAVADQQVREAKEMQATLSKSKKDMIRYSGRFVKESFPDKFEVAPGVHFTKSWIMRNDGETAWPQDVVLIQTNGDELGAAPVALAGQVLPQQEYEWTVSFTAPQAEGQYLCYFRMTTGDNIRFGHKIWCSILVKKPVEPALEAAVQMQKQDEEISDSELYEDGNDVQMHVDKSGEAPVDNEPKEILNKPTNPKTMYFDAVELETDAALKKQLTDLYEFGFVTFKVNKHLLQKYAKDANPTNTVCEILLTGALNESSLDALWGAGQPEE